MPIAQLVEVVSAVKTQRKWTARQLTLFDTSPRICWRLIARRAQVQLAYAIGVVEPLSVRVDTFGTGTCARRENHAGGPNSMSLSPKGIMERFGLQRPIYAVTASGGHFGRPGFPWEELSLVAELKKRLEGESKSTTKK